MSILACGGAYPHCHHWFQQGYHRVIQRRKPGECWRPSPRPGVFGFAILVSSISSTSSGRRVGCQVVRNWLKKPLPPVDAAVALVPGPVTLWLGVPPGHRKSKVGEKEASLLASQLSGPASWCPGCWRVHSFATGLSLCVGFRVSMRDTFYPPPCDSPVRLLMCLHSELPAGQHTSLVSPRRHRSITIGGHSSSQLLV